MIEFPTMVHRCPGRHSIAGGSYDYIGVNDQQELDAVLAAGWSLTLPEAIERHNKLEFLKKEAAAKVKRAQEEAVNAVVENAAVLIQELEDEEEFDDSPKRKRKR
jgi:hypothetical protein